MTATSRPLVDQATFDKMHAIRYARYVIGEKPQHHIHYLRGDHHSSGKTSFSSASPKVSVCRGYGAHERTIRYRFRANGAAL